MKIRTQIKRCKENVEAQLWAKNLRTWSKTKTYPSIRLHFLKFATKNIQKCLQERK